METPEVRTASDDTWFTPRKFAALLGVLVFVSYPQVFLGFQTFIYRDFGGFSYPIAFHLQESFRHGEMPLWNPLNNCGTPFLAQWNTQVLYPPALFYLLFPLSWSLGLFCLLHLFLGGWGMFLLANHWTRNRFAAAFAGVVFSFNGLMLNSLMWPATIAALGWMPWVVWLTEQAWRKGGRRLIVAAIVGALQMLTGGTEVILLTWFLLGALGLFELIRGELPRRKTFLRTGLVVLLITGLSAAQLLPFFDLVNCSRRQENIFASQWPMPATGWLNFLVPLFRCHPYQGGVFMQIGQSWTASYYVGVITLALAAWAVWRSRRGQVWLLAALTLLCLLLALGDATPVYRWLNQHFSVMGLVRFPIKFVILPVFALALLGAFGLAEKQCDARQKTIRTGGQWCLIWFATVALIAGIIWLNYRPQLPSDDESAESLNGLIRMALFTAIIGGLVLMGKSSNLKFRQWLQLLLLLLVWLDLLRHAPQPPTVDRAIYTPNAFLLQSSPPRLGVARAMIPPSMLTKLYNTFLPNLAEDYLNRRLTLSLNCNLLDDVPTVNGFFPLLLPEHLALSNGDPTNPLLDFLGVSQILDIESNTFAWKARATFMPLLTAGQRPVFADDTIARQQLASTNFNPRQKVYLPTEAKIFIRASSPTRVKISAARYSAQQIEARIKADAPAMLVAAQTYYHPWRAYVDGKPTPLWRADYSFQALEIPSGSHCIKLVYEDRQFYLGGIISVTTLAGCLLFLCLRHRATTEELSETAKISRG
jgi:hypothetical protein